MSEPFRKVKGMETMARTPEQPGSTQGERSAGEHIHRLLSLAESLTTAAAHCTAASLDSAGKQPLVHSPLGIELSCLSEKDVVSWAQNLEQLNRHLQGLLVQAAGELSERFYSGRFAENGSRKPIDLLTTSLKLSRTEASRRIRLASHFMPSTDLFTQTVTPPCQPILSSAFFSGQVSIDQALIISDFVDDASHIADSHRIPAEKPQELEETLTEYAQVEPPDFLRRIGARAMSLLDPDGQKPTEAELTAKQGIYFRQPRRGLIHFGGHVTIRQYEHLMSGIGWATSPKQHGEPEYADTPVTEPSTAGGHDGGHIGGHDDPAPENAESSAPDEPDPAGQDGTAPHHSVRPTQDEEDHGKSSASAEPSPAEAGGSPNSDRAENSTPTTVSAESDGNTADHMTLLGSLMNGGLLSGNLMNGTPEDPPAVKEPSNRPDMPTRAAEPDKPEAAEGWVARQDPSNFSAAMADAPGTTVPNTSGSDSRSDPDSNPGSRSNSEPEPDSDSDPEPEPWPHLVGGVWVPEPGSLRELEGMDLIDPNSTDPAVQDKRTHGQKLLDGLISCVQLAARTGKLPMNGGLKSQLYLSLTQEDLDRKDGTATVLAPYSGPAPLPLFAQDLCDSEVTELFQGIGGEILDVGRTRRLFTFAQRKILLARDMGCAFPDCMAPAPWTHAHHIIPWQDGGVTSIENGVLVCEVHHHYLHESDWTVRLVGGTAWFTPPYSADIYRKERRNTYHHGIARP